MAPCRPQQSYSNLNESYLLHNSGDSDSSHIAITGSEAKSHYGSWVPANAHDGNFDTLYSVKDSDAVGNYLKLFLDNVYHISHVDVTNRLNGFWGRFIGTRVKVITTNKDKETDCGTVESLYFAFC